MECVKEKRERAKRRSKRALNGRGAVVLGTPVITSQVVTASTNHHSGGREQSPTLVVPTHSPRCVHTPRAAGLLCLCSPERPPAHPCFVSFVRPSESSATQEITLPLAPSLSNPSPPPPLYASCVGRGVSPPKVCYLHPQILPSPSSSLPLLLLPPPPTHTLLPLLHPPTPPPRHRPADPLPKGRRPSVHSSSSPFCLVQKEASLPCTHTHKEKRRRKNAPPDQTHPPRHGLPGQRGPHLLLLLLLLLHLIPAKPRPCHPAPHLQTKSLRQPQC